MTADGCIVRDPSSEPLTAMPDCLQETSIKRAGLAGKWIMVVEEEAFIGLTEVEILTEAGCRAFGPATSFEEAAMLIAAAPIDAALVDGTIFYTPANEVAAALAQRDIPFVFVSAYPSFYLRTKLSPQFRDVPVLDKPFQAWQMLDAVEALLERRAGSA
jgi:DNA-binding NtrC family response regulator